MPKQNEHLFDFRCGPYGDVMQPWQEIETRANPPAGPMPLPEIRGESDKNRIERLLDRLAFTSRQGPGMNERNNFVTKHRWIPYHQGEVTTASRGLKLHLDIVGRTKQGNRAAALNSVLHDFDKYRLEATLTKETLREALVDEDLLEENVLPEPEAGVIRRNERIEFELVNFILAKESLDSFQWYPAGKNRQITQATQKRMAELKSLIQKMNDEQLVRLWQVAYVSTGSRARFWADQYNALKDEQDDRLSAAQSRL